jgi:hypothetical protein
MFRPMTSFDGGLGQFYDTMKIMLSESLFNGISSPPRLLSSLLCSVFVQQETTHSSDRDKVVRPQGRRSFPAAGGEGKAIPFDNSKLRKKFN